MNTILYTDRHFHFHGKIQTSRIPGHTTGFQCNCVVLFSQPAMSESFSFPIICVVLSAFKTEPL